MPDAFYNDFPQRIEEFHQNEPRAFCYDLALSLINEAKENKNGNWYTDQKTIQGIILLLFCWNFASPITKRLTNVKIITLLEENYEILTALEAISITTEFNDEIKKKIIKVFGSFRIVLGQTGASKALSLLNPKLFIMWDTKIREKLRNEGLITGVYNGERPEYYLKYLIDMKAIIGRNNLVERVGVGNNIAKKIDEFHYAKILC